MAITTSAHMGTTISFLHNARVDKVVSKEEHINPDGRHMILEEGSVGVEGHTLREKYDQIFGEATKEYNDRQRRDDRKISSYYEKIKAQQSKGEQTGNKSAKKLAYEVILTFGDYTNYNPGLSNEQIDRDEAVKALSEVVEEIKRDNPHLAIVGAYLHDDEYHTEYIDGKEVEVCGAPHVHLDFVPVAEKYKQGMSIQNGLKKALQQDGHTGRGIKDTPQMAFQRSLLDKMDAKAKELGFEAIHPIRDGQEEKRDHLEKNDYVLKQQDEKIQEQKKELVKTNEQIKQLDAVKEEVASNEKELSLLKGEKTPVSEISEAVNTALDSIEQLEPANDAIVEKLKALKPIKKSHFAKDKSIEYEVRLSKEERDSLIATKEQLDADKQQFSFFKTLTGNIRETFDKVRDLFRQLSKEHDDRQAELDDYSKELSAIDADLADKDYEIERVMSGQEYQEKKAEVDKAQKEHDDLTDQNKDLQRENRNVQEQLRRAREELTETKKKCKDQKRSYYEEQFLEDYKPELDEYIKEQERLEREREEDEYCL